jgi:hypothetical protein
MVPPIYFHVFGVLEGKELKNNSLSGRLARGGSRGYPTLKRKRRADLLPPAAADAGGGGALQWLPSARRWGRAGAARVVCGAGGTTLEALRSMTEDAVVRRSSAGSRGGWQRGVVRRQGRVAVARAQVAEAAQRGSARRLLASSGWPSFRACNDALLVAAGVGDGERRA